MRFFGGTSQGFDDSLVMMKNCGFLWSGKAELIPIGLRPCHLPNKIISWYWWQFCIIMSKDADHPLFVSRNKYVAAASLIYLNGNNNEDKKLYQVTNIYIWSNISFNKKNFFNQSMVNFFNKLDFNYNKCQNNGTIILWSLRKNDFLIWI